MLGVGGNVGQGIIKAISIGNLLYYLVNACVSYNSLGLHTFDKAYLSPYVRGSNFMPWLIKYVMTGIFIFINKL